MPFQIVCTDIRKLDCDAIVELAGGAGTASEGPEPGSIAVTDAVGLPCRYVFRASPPVWERKRKDKEAQLRDCYLRALRRAEELGLTSIALPLISPGGSRFPKDKVLNTALKAISEFLDTTDSDMQICLCVPDRSVIVLDEDAALREFLERPEGLCSAAEQMSASSDEWNEDLFDPNVSCCDAIAEDLAEWIRDQDDSFAVMLLKLIDKRGMTDVQCYKKANVSRGTFWRINNEATYRPSRETVIAFAIALELNMDETAQLLKTVGFSLSNSNTFDRIIQYFILKHNYDIYEINEALFHYDQKCLGS